MRRRGCCGIQTRKTTPTIRDNSIYNACGKPTSPGPTLHPLVNALFQPVSPGYNKMLEDKMVSIVELRESFILIVNC